jgi:hypothetical protein
MIMSFSIQEKLSLELKYLRTKDTHTLSYFHTPKILKPGILKGRPIISSIHSITTLLFSLELQELIITSHPLKFSGVKDRIRVQY